MKTFQILSILALSFQRSGAFVTPHTPVAVALAAFSTSYTNTHTHANTPTPSTSSSTFPSQLQMMDVSSVAVVDMTAVSAAIDAAPTIMISETEAWVKPMSQVLGPFLNLFSFAMLCRVVISWYPSAKLNEFPYNIIVWPTEPLLVGIRGSIPPAFGVDITPIVWLGVFTFFNEILLGQQGLLTMKMKYGI